MERNAHLLRDVADSIGLTSMRQLARQPGVRRVYRLTTYHPDERARNSVATLRDVNLEALVLEVVHQARFNHKPIVHTVQTQRFEGFVTTLQNAGFDWLHDQPDLSLYDIDLWMLERAAGDFLKSVILSPNKPEMPYSMIVNAVDSYLPEALREVS